MISMNIFTQDAFSAMSLSTAIDKLDYIPDTISAIPGLFVPDPVRTETIWIEDRSTGAVVLPFSPRGTAPHQTGGDNRNARSFKTLRYGDASRITASELLAIRAFGSEVALKDLQMEVARRQQKIKNNTSLSVEFHKFNCITQAKVLNADGTTVYDWASEFNQAIPAEVDFDVVREQDQETNQWHLDKKVPISLLLAILLQTCGFAWWGATQSEKVAVLKERLDAIAPQADRLTRVEVNIESIKESLADIKMMIRPRPQN
jgi:hypothetical protein